jgi:hypothetical protein
VSSFNIKEKPRKKYATINLINKIKKKTHKISTFSKLKNYRKIQLHYALSNAKLENVFQQITLS